MEQAILVKNKKFNVISKSVVQKFILFDKIIKKVTSAVLNNAVRAEANIKTTEELNRFYEAVEKNLDILIELYEHCDNKAADSLSQLVSIENDLTLFTYKPPNLNQYKPNTNGECMIVKICDPSNGRCYMNDLKEPELQISSICRENLTKFSESGEVFAVELEDRRLYRAVRSDLIFRERPKIIVYLLDVGKRLEIPYNLNKFYSLPDGMQKMESRAIACKVVEIIDGTGLSVNTATNIQAALNQPVRFLTENVKGNILWIKICLKAKNDTADEIAVPAASGKDSAKSLDLNEKMVHQTNDSFTSYRTPAAKFKFNSDICHSGFSTKSEIEMHMNAHVRVSRVNKSDPKKKAKLHICQYCDKSLNHKGNLKQYLRIHTGEKPYACDICEKLFNQRGSLHHHKKIHTGKKPHKCNICGRAFIRKRALLHHLQTHNIICKICNKIFPQIIDLKRHIKVHKDKTAVICNTCGKMFSENSSLKRHLNSHTKAKSYPCKICGKIFFLYHTLKMHLQIHSGKEFKCRICEKTFTYKHHLDIHLRIHTGERPFACKICKKAFTRSDHLKTHSLVHH